MKKQDGLLRLYLGISDNTAVDSPDGYVRMYTWWWYRGVGWVIDRAKAMRFVNMKESG